MGNRRNVARFLAGTCLLAASAGVAHSEVRSLSLINTHTQERASIVFKRDGVYDQNGLQELNRLLRDWRRNEVTRMDPQLFDLIWEVYRDSGSHQPIHIVSGYRSPTTNNALRSRSRGVAKFSQHMLGKAMDFYLPDVNLSLLREIGMKKQTGGVGFYPTSGSPFVHMDTGSVRAWPRMTREQLVRLFPDGRTAHLPADGNPLPGYQTALADSEARKSRGGGTTSSSSGGGLLAALFGGGSSSSSSYSGGEDEDEGSVPASRRTQELRQGPLPAASAPSRVARSESVPGVADVPVYRSKPVQPQVRLAEVDVPEPAPRAAAAAAPQPVAAPVPTTTAKGSLVGLPIAAPMPQPSPLRVASAGQPVPSRYGPTGNELPPGWVQGPSGRQPMDSRQLAALAAEPSRGTPIAVPLPMARPGSQAAQMILAAAELPHGTPIAVALPKPRPGGALRTAFEPAADATQALAALTGEPDERLSALGYASHAAPEAAGFATASLPPAVGPRQAPLGQTAALAADTRAPGEIPSRYAVQPPSPTNAAVARSAAQAAKADRIAEPSARLYAGKSDRASEARLLDGAATTAGAGFAQLRHPDQDALTGLLSKPGTTLASGFGRGAIDDLAQYRFTGPAIVALAVLRTQ